ncbi:MAG: ammonium transporter [bacterium]
MKEMLDNLNSSGDILLLIWGAALVFSMHAGFAFLEAGSVRRKNVVNALTKIVMDWSVSTFVYLLVGFTISYGITFLKPVKELGFSANFDFVHFFFLLTFAACIPAIISGGIAERAKFGPQVAAGAILVGLFYPIFERLVWGSWSNDFNMWLTNISGAGFHDYAGSVAVHAMGGWMALPAIMILGPRLGRYRQNGQSEPITIHSIPYVALGSWFLMVGWFGFNVASSGHLKDISGLVAINSLMAMVGGVISASLFSKNDSVAIYNGALAGLVAVCAGSDKYHPLGAAAVGIIAGIIFVKAFSLINEKWRLDDVLGVWPLHGLCGAWGGIACGIFGLEIFGGVGGVTLGSQLIGTVICIAIALIGSYITYTILNKTVGIRLNAREETLGSDLVVHSSKAYPEDLF